MHLSASATLSPPTSDSDEVLLGLIQFVLHAGRDARCRQNGRSDTLSLARIETLVGGDKHMRRKLWHVYSTFQAMMSTSHAVMVQETGQDLMEYTMVFAVIALAATAGMQSVAGGVSMVFTTIGTTLRIAMG